MSDSTITGTKRVASILAATAATFALFFAASPQPAAAAGFCTNAWLSPYGQGGDRCWGPAKRALYRAEVITYERAGCVNIADGSNNLTQSWACGPSGSAPGYAAAVGIPIYPNFYYKGVIRNNNLSFSGKFSGFMVCYAAYPC
jgi:hypothetical protein